MQSSISILQQLKNLLTALSPTEYAQPLSVFNGSSLGGHTRHIIEFYECWLKSLETGIINYDGRERDKQIEQNRDYAIVVLNRIIRKLQTGHFADCSLCLEGVFGGENFSVPTFSSREEVYLVEHAIHHFALMRIGVETVFSDIQIPANFGVAHSTVVFREKNVILQ